MNRILLVLLCMLPAIGYGQVQYPYNPDSEPDGYIGVGDILELLSIFGQEFSLGMLQTDSSSAILYVGDMDFWDCKSSCASLTVNWRVLDDHLVGTYRENLQEINNVWISEPVVDDLQYSTVLIWSDGGLNVIEKNRNVENSCVCQVRVNPLIDDINPCADLDDECGVCQGPGAIYECGCNDIPEGDCDCDGNQLDALNECGGACLADADGDGVCDPVVWNQLGADIDGEAAGDGSGWRVSLSADGSIVAIGAPNNDGENGQYSGHVRLYEWNESAWNQLGDDIDGEAENNWSGSVSLSADGTTVAIGAHNNDGVNGADSGHVRLYQFSEVSIGGSTVDVWNQLGEDIDGEAAYDYSGVSISLSADGTIVAIGAQGNDGVNGNDSGHVRLYQWSGDAWNQLGEDIDGEAEYDQSGGSVSLSSDGSIVAIGAQGNDGNFVNGSGHVRLYQWSGAAWVQLGEDIDGEAQGDWSGTSVSLSADGSIVAIGANNNDGVNGSNSGHVRLYQWSGAAWNQLGEDIDGEAEYDWSGWHVSLSADGSIVAIGSDANSGNGAYSGHVRLYQWSGAAWVQLGEDIDGEAGGDVSGSSISLSADGSTVAIGAPSNDGNGSNSGHVRVFSPE